MTAAVVVGLVAVLVAVGWLFSLLSATTAEISEASMVADPRLTLAGTAASPVSDEQPGIGDEPPLLAPLVDDGELPPLADRLPDEPLVLRGVEGVGRYGGTLLRAATSPGDVNVISWRLSYAAPVRWTAGGDDIVPHVAKSLTTDDGGRTWTFTLRDGHRWSDGHPLTSGDVLYWWNHEILDDTLGGEPPHWILNGGEVPTFERVSDTIYTVRYETPNNLFREMVASFGHQMFNSPKQYKEPFHPTLGDPEVIAEQQRAFSLPSPRAVYAHLSGTFNPEHPRLWPWIYREHRSNPPQVFVRNPYYFAIDEAGRQLPYVDRVQFDLRREDLIPLDAAAGRLSMQSRHLRFGDWSEYATRALEGLIRLLAWQNASGSDYLVYPNLNRRVEADKPETAWKAKLLNERDFRRALSLAVDRKEIIAAEYKDLTRPSQIAPGPGSPYHDESLAMLNAQHDPAEAERLLDGLGLKRQGGGGGMRTFPDGSPMVWFVDYTPFTGRGAADFIVDQWASVGLRVVGRERSRSLLNLGLRGRTIDLMIWSGESDFAPLVSPRNFVPHTNQSFYAPGWGNWHSMGGHGGRQVETKQAFPPPQDSPAMRAMDLYAKARTVEDEAERIAIFKEMWRIAAEEVWTINVSTAPPVPVVVDPDLRNVPERAIAGYIYNTPGNAGLETWFFETKSDSDGAIAQARQSLIEPTPMPRPGGLPPDDVGSSIAGRLAGWIVPLAVIGGLLVLGLRYPFIGRRLLIMVPTLGVLSVLIFAVIQAPPGDYLTARLAELEESGSPNAMQQIDELRETFHFDEPAVKQYLRWSGLWWFTSFDAADRGLLQGDLGTSMQTGQPVGLIVGDRLLLTVLISAGTILFVWAVALPIGVYSAVYQYSAGDYLASLIGFVGMAVPNFLLALVLMALAGVSGLFSAEYAAQPEWTWGKVLDLLGHVWVPIVVLGTGGTAAMIRVMRANLLDELSKPYVTVARSKGVKPLKLLVKYPVRLAINPFVSGIGGLLPQLVSGGAIVAIVLSLPTVGPLLLEALFLQDMYLAGSLLMVLSLLGIVGTLLSDLLLMLVDPRIRMEGGSR
jgi:ABC-type dipeptide/oligopeptide/nickel transport system permease component/ABC-type transport system substrate-binding protein